MITYFLVVWLALLGVTNSYSLPESGVAGVCNEGQYAPVPGSACVRFVQCGSGGKVSASQPCAQGTLFSGQWCDFTANVNCAEVEALAEINFPVAGNTGEEEYSFAHYYPGDACSKEEEKAGTVQYSKGTSCTHYLLCTRFQMQGKPDYQYEEEICPAGTLFDISSEVRCVDENNVYCPDYTESEETNHLQYLQHESTPNVADVSNEIIDIANKFNAKSLDELKQLDNFDVAVDVEALIEEICPPIICDDTTKHTRTADGTCNNVDNPIWGSAGNTQQRHTPATWETTSTLTFDYDEPSFLQAVGPHGVQLQSNIVFQVKGTGPFTLTVSSPSAAKCEQFECDGSNSNVPTTCEMVDGLIENVEVIELKSGSSCVRDSSFGFSGNKVLVSGNCIATLKACYFPTAVRVVLLPASGDASTLEVDYQVHVHVGNQPLFNNNEISLFCMNLEGGVVTVGTGCLCDEGSVFLRVQHTLNLLDVGPTALARSIGAGLHDTTVTGASVTVTFPVSDTLVLRTSSSDVYGGNIKYLDEVRHVHEGTSLQFKILNYNLLEEEAVIDLYNTNNEVPYVCEFRRCNSNNNRERRCAVDNIIHSIRINTEDVGSECKLDVNYEIEGNEIVMTQAGGCRARFEVCHAPLDVTCERINCGGNSENGEARCSVEKNIHGVSLIEQLSIDNCTVGYTLTFEGKDVVVTQGCSAKVLVCQADEAIPARVSISLFKRKRSEITAFIGGVEVASQRLDSRALTTASSEFWISWHGCNIYVGEGSIVHSNTLNPSLDIGHALMFSVEKVELRSTAKPLWSFDIVQKNVPRATSRRCGTDLPTARDVSLLLHSTLDQEDEKSPDLTLMALQYGQLLDHDMTATSLEINEEMEIMCVQDFVPLPKDKQSRFCFNIPITDKTDSNGLQGEFPSDTHKAMGFIRSSASLDCDPTDRDIGMRENPNVISSYIDASNVYGSSEEETNELRESIDEGTGEIIHSAFLRFETRPNGDIQLPGTNEEGEAPCRSSGISDLCKEAGDFRVNEHPGLTAIHTIFLREHNRIVEALVALGMSNANEDQEKLFQTARRIVYAEMQKIVLDYLNSFMNKARLAAAGISLDEGGYNATLDASTRHMAGICYRFGHSWITKLLPPENLNKNVPEVVLQGNFFRPGLGNGGATDGIMRGMTKNLCGATDKRMTKTATENMFFTEVDSGLDQRFDLAAFNIQRGRDHGVASYCNLLESFNIKPPKTFEEAEFFSETTIENLKKCYDDICDVDMFTFCVSEMPLPDSAIGKTLHLILEDLFNRLKNGDRFWFEHDEGFTAEQKIEIKKASLARVLCDNIPSQTDTQVDVFRIETDSNPRVDCTDIESVNLAPFASLQLQGKDVEETERELETLIDLLQKMREKENEET